MLLGEGDCAPRDEGTHNDNRDCKGGTLVRIDLDILHYLCLDLVCGSNNCRKFGLYYHEKDDCCERKPSLMTSPLMKEPETIVILNQPSNTG